MISFSAGSAGLPASATGFENIIQDFPAQCNFLHFFSQPISLAVKKATSISLMASSVIGNDLIVVVSNVRILPGSFPYLIEGNIALGQSHNLCGQRIGLIIKDAIAHPIVALPGMEVLSLRAME